MTNKVNAKNLILLLWVSSFGIIIGFYNRTVNNTGAAGDFYLALANGIYNVNPPVESTDMTLELMNSVVGLGPMCIFVALIIIAAVGIMSMVMGMGCMCD